MSKDKSESVKEFPSITESFLDYFRILYKPGDVIKRRTKKASDFLTSLVVVIASSAIFSFSVLLSGEMSYALIHSNFTTYWLELWTSGALVGLYLPSSNYVLTLLSLNFFILKLWLFSSLIYWILLIIFGQDTDYIKSSETIAWSIGPFSLAMLLIATIAFILELVIPLYAYLMYLVAMPIILVSIIPVYQAVFNKERGSSMMASIWAYFLTVLILYIIYLLNHPAIFYYLIL